MTDGQRQPDYPAYLGLLRSLETQVIALHRSEFEATGNALSVWDAIAFVTEIRDLAIKVGENFTDLVLPSWCADYLSKAAVNLLSLADGVPTTGRDQSNPRPQGPAIDDRLSPSQAQALIPSALGLSSRGSSAFGRRRNAIENTLLFYRFDDLRRSGLSYEEAVNELKLIRPTIDASGLAKRVAAGKRSVQHQRRFIPPYKPPATGES